MKKKTTFTVLALVLLALIAGAAVLYNALSADFKPDLLVMDAPGETVPAETAPPHPQVHHEEVTAPPTEAEVYYAPDFTVTDWEGNEVRLSDYRGKPVVLNFWASWCGPCKMEMPDFDAAFALRGEDVQFLMVNLTDGSQETVESAKAFIEDAGYSFPVLFDTGYEAAIAYGVSGIPATYLISPEGELMGRAVGAIDAETLEYGISLITGS